MGRIDSVNTPEQRISVELAVTYGGLETWSFLLTSAGLWLRALSPDKGDRIWGKETILDRLSGRRSPPCATCLPTATLSDPLPQLGQFKELNIDDVMTLLLEIPSVTIDCRLEIDRVKIDLQERSHRKRESN